jgi:diguanylate cyclase (GGDEF)-like protein
MTRPSGAQRDGGNQRIRTAYVMTSALLIVAYPFLNSVGQAIAYSLVSFGALFLVLIGLKSTERASRLPWQLLVAALFIINFAILIGHVGTNVARDISSLLDAVGNAIILAAALVLVVRRGRNDIDGLIDATIVGFAVGGLVWAALMPPGRAASVSFASTAALFLVLFALTGVLGALMRLAGTALEVSPALVLLSTALTLALVANIVLFVSTEPWLDALASMMFMATYTCVGVFGLHPAAARLAEVGPARPGEALSTRRLTMLGVALVAIPAVIGSQALLGGEINGLLLIIGSVLVASLVMLRIGRLLGQRAHAERALEHQASHDGLTGLINRPHFMAALADELSIGQNSTILFCDLNGFKTVNDEHGHAAGDQLLVEVAQRLQICVRETDVVSRFGGDEFLILLRDAKLVDAYAICDRIASALADPIGLSSGHANVGASIGIAVAAGDADAEHLIGRADRAMYRAKAIQSTKPAVRVAEAA